MKAVWGGMNFGEFQVEMLREIRAGGVGLCSHLEFVQYEGTTNEIQRFVRRFQTVNSSFSSIPGTQFFIGKLSRWSLILCAILENPVNP
jgi:hypothetical protein